MITYGRVHTHRGTRDDDCEAFLLYVLQRKLRCGAGGCRPGRNNWLSLRQQSQRRSSESKSWPFYEWDRAEFEAKGVPVLL